jgi:hypothetical protein
VGDNYLSDVKIWVYTNAVTYMKNAGVYTDTVACMGNVRVPCHQSR